MKRTQRNRGSEERRRRAFSHISSEAASGSYAIDGFEFQDRWARLYCLQSIGQDSDEDRRDKPVFHGIRLEGLDDVTIYWGAPSGKKPDFTEFAQAKWHIESHILNEVLITYEKRFKDSSSKKLAFRVVAGSCAANLRTLADLIERVNRAREPGGEGSQEFRDSRADLADRLKRLKLNVDVDFLLAYVTLELGNSFLLDSTMYGRLINAELVNNSVLKEHVEKALGRLEKAVTSRGPRQFVSAQHLLDLLSPFKHKAPAVSLRTEAQSSGDTLESTKIFAPVRSAEFRVTIFQGEATLIEMPDERLGLVDCDRRSTEQLIAHLQGKKERHFSFIALTHWHADHYSGLPGVLEYADEIESIYLPHQNPENLSSAASAVLNIVHSRLRTGATRLCHLIGLTEVLRLQTPNGRTLGRITVSGPSLEKDATRGDRDIPDPNDTSAVFRISVGDTTLLVAGDATLQRWRDALSQWRAVDDPLECDGLLLPHNGSRACINSEILLQIAKPTGFLAALTPGNPAFRLPHPDVLESVQRLGGHLVRLADRPLHLILSPEGLLHRVAPNSISDVSRSQRTEGGIANK